MPTRQASHRWLVAAVVLASVGVLGGVATVLAANGSIDDARDADRRTAARAAEQLAARLTVAASSLAGADALAAGESVAPEAVESFAAGVVMTADFAALAWCEPVDAADRARWEAAAGAVIKDTDGAGGFVDAPARDRYVAVRYVAPDSELASGLIGFDLLSDPVRGDGVRQAVARESTVLVGPIMLANSARPGLFAVRAVRGGDGSVVGYIAGGLALDDLLAQLERIPNISDVTVSVDGDGLVGDGDGATSASFELAGRTFTVETGARSGPSWWLPAVLVGGTALAWIVAVRSFRRYVGERRRQDRGRERTERLAALGTRLATVASTDAVVQAICEQGAPAVGARYASVGRRSDADPSTLRIVHDVRMDPELAAAAFSTRIDARIALADCARRGKLVTVPDREAYAARYPDALDEIERAGIEAAVCVPLSLGGDGSVGVIGFAFDRRLSPPEIDGVESAAQLVAQMAGRAYERAFARELVQSRAQLLSEFARSLSSAQTADEVRTCVGAMLPPVLGLRAAVMSDDAPTGLADTQRHYPPVSPGGEHLVVTLPAGRAWSPTEESLATTVVDLVDGAITRAHLHDQQRAILQQMQESLLKPPAVPPGFDVGVGYRSAVEAVGMGGDWYSIVETPSALFAVIGDIVGHGPEAVALMAEVKTVMRHLLAAGAPIDEVLEQAHGILRRRGAYASAAIACLRKHEHTLTYVNAGHVPPLLVSGDRIERLATVHRPVLGVGAVEAYAPSEHPFGDGDLLVLYTDGLIEERSEIIDVSIDRLVASLDVTMTADRLVHTLLDQRRCRTSPTMVDDDIAVVAARRVPITD